MHVPVRQPQGCRVEPVLAEADLPDRAQVPVAAAHVYNSRGSCIDCVRRLMDDGIPDIGDSVIHKWFIGSWCRQLP